MTTDEKALVQTGWVMPPATVKQRMDEIVQYQAVMVEDEDYGTIPGTQKPTLYQPGADTLCQAADLATGKPEFIEKVEDWQTPFFYYLVSLAVMNAEGRVLAVGVGSCNSKEKKYASRWVPLFTLSDAEKALATAESWPREERTSKKGQKHQWVSKPSDDIYDQVNTLQKMAVKRAYISAVLRATGATRVFTQDMEDMPGVVEGEVRELPPEPPRSAEPKKAAPRKRQAPASDDGAGPATEQQATAIYSLLSRKFTEQANRVYWLSQNAAKGLLIETAEAEGDEEPEEFHTYDLASLQKLTSAEASTAIRELNNLPDASAD